MKNKIILLTTPKCKYAFELPRLLSTVTNRAANGYVTPPKVIILKYEIESTHLSENKIIIMSFDNKYSTQTR